MISVILSNFNGLRFLPKLLESLRAQRGVEVELILVDRASTDGSREFLATQADVSVVNEPPQSGDKPIRTNASLKLAFSDAKMMSQASAKFVPAPAHTP